MGTLVISYVVPGKCPVAVAAVDDPQMLEQVAKTAILEAECLVAQASDPVMACLRGAEVSRLKAALSILVPGLNSEVTVVN